MPPIPGPGQRPSVQAEDRPKRPPVKDQIKTSPRVAQPRRQTKVDNLEGKIERIYKMAGTALKPFGRFYPFMGVLGQNCKDLSSEAAEAWMELAEENREVYNYLVKLTSASATANVIGVHLAIVAGSLPGTKGFVQEMQQQPVGNGPVSSDDPNELFRQMGYTDDDIVRARQMVAEQQMQRPQRNTETGGPGDTVAAPPPPKFDPAQAKPAPVESAAPTGGQHIRPGIVSPAELGAQNASNDDNIFPHDPGAAQGR